jgi:condensin complex subunit 3
MFKTLFLFNEFIILIFISKTDFKTFFDTFTLMLQPLLSNMQGNRHFDNSIDFICKFITTPPNSKDMDATMSQENNNSQKNKSKNEGEESTLMDTIDDEYTEKENILLTYFIQFLLDNNKASADAVRYRTCQILSKLMIALNNDQIDEDIFDLICDSMLERLKDINSRVQQQAIAAIYRLQDPNDRECRVIHALKFLMTYDPNWQVRYQALSHVAFSKTTLSDIIDRVRDPNPMVRRKALVILSEKVLIKFISIEKRLFILNYALQDFDKGVVDTCCRKLLPSWLAFKENDICKLLKALDVVEATETIELMLNKMHANATLDSICNDFIVNLDEKKVVPLDKLTAESAFYWTWVCSKCKVLHERDPGRVIDKVANGNDNDSLSSHDGSDSQLESNYDDYLDNILPSLTEYCTYIGEVLKKFDAERIEFEKDDRHQLENVFTMKQLMNIFSYIDFSDLHGKKVLLSLCQSLFSNRNYTFLFDSVYNIYKKIQPNLQQRMNNLTELISDLKDPITVAPTQAESDLNKSKTNDPTNNNTDTSPSTPSIKMTDGQIRIKLSELKYKKIQLKDEFENLYRQVKNISENIDIEKLAHIRQQIKDVEEEMTCLQNQLDRNSSTPPSQPTSKVTESMEVDASTTNQNEPFDSEKIASHSLEIAICMLKDNEVKTLLPQLRSICDTLILPNICSVNEHIRILSVRALNLICIIKLEMARKYVPLFLQFLKRDKTNCVIEAFKAIVNCIMAHSINKLIEPSTVGDGENDQESQTEASTRILSFMYTLLDHEDEDIQTVAVESFCKLYMTGHIVSAKLFSKLLIMYYSPLFEQNVRLKSCLASFLPQFAFFRASNQVCVEESFLITVKCLINATPDSQFGEIDLIKVTENLYHLTNPKNLMVRRVANQVQRAITNVCHENIVKSLCYEILKNENVYRFKVYLKIIQMADLTSADFYSLKEIYELAQEIEDHIDDRMIKKTATKYCETILNLLKRLPQYQKEERERLEKQRREEEGNVTTLNNTTTTTTAQIDKTIQNETTQNDKSTVNSSQSSSGGDLIDLEFRKLNKTKKTNDTVVSTRHSPRISRISQPSSKGIEVETSSNVLKQTTVSKNKIKSKITITKRRSLRKSTSRIYETESESDTSTANTSSPPKKGKILIPDTDEEDEVESENEEKEEEEEEEEEESMNSSRRSSRLPSRRAHSANENGKLKLKFKKKEVIYLLMNLNLKKNLQLK